MSKEPTWKTYQYFKYHHINKNLLSWLLYPGSLTERLKANCEEFFVRIISLKWQPPHLSEAKILNIPARQYSYIRQVELVCDGNPWVYARTVIPRQTLLGKQKALLHLGTKPLGHYIFNQPDMRRGEFQMTSFDKNHEILSGYTPTDISDRLWARRSIFYINEKPLLITEIFTPYVLRFSTF